MSTLKHNIRQQQAQLNNLETMLRGGPRPLPPPSPPRSPDLSEIALPQQPPTAPPPPSTTTTKMQRRSSFDVLHSLAGPDSSLPLPIPYRDGRGSPMKPDGSIPEGIPIDFGVGSTSPSSYKRMPSPTRTLSRMSVSIASLTHAVSRVLSLYWLLRNSNGSSWSVMSFFILFSSDWHATPLDRQCPRPGGRGPTRCATSLQIARFGNLRRRRHFTAPQRINIITASTYIAEQTTIADARRNDQSPGRPPVGSGQCAQRA